MFIRTEKMETTHYDDTNNERLVKVYMPDNQFNDSDYVIKMENFSVSTNKRSDIDITISFEVKEPSSKDTSTMSNAYDVLAYFSEWIESLNDVTKKKKELVKTVELTFVTRYCTRWKRILFNAIPTDVSLPEENKCVVGLIADSYDDVFQ